MGNEKETHEPIRQSVHVECPVEDAFRLFTEAFAEWWPGDDQEQCAIQKGSVTVWDPPSRIEFSWRPGAPPRDGQIVNVEFQAEPDGTRVTLTHWGWHTCGRPSSAAPFAEFVAAHVLVAA